MSQTTAILAELRRFGVTGRVDAEHKHPRVYFETPIGERFVTCAATSSDRRSDDVALARVRRMLGVTAARPKSSRVRKHRARRVEMPPAPDCIDVKPDPYRMLDGTELMAGVLRLRLDRAWKALWREACLEATGFPSAVAIMGVR